MPGSSYMTVAGLLYAFVAAGILCRVFFHFASNAGPVLSGSSIPNSAEGRERIVDKLMDVALALPLLMVGFALQALGYVMSGGLNWLGVALALALAFGLLFYGLMKSELVEKFLALRAPPRGLPAPTALLPTSEARPEIVDVEELRPAAEIKTLKTGKQGRQPRTAG